eukprot:TRINITY_DN12532_c0_g1_i10.p2 TRINITY_DN12532_c0_g1~~TRINITY_DN12532_c0_g1_i10.p2  ORF type:complete len:111 (+),score=20.11 TRINITY_DN12532_c0_g1_i10:293-625(+)
MVAWRAHDSGLIYLKPHQLPCKELGNIKEWLDDSDIKFTEGPLNFNWKSIMKTINEDFSGFLETGGWSFLEENDVGAASMWAGQLQFACAQERVCDKGLAVAPVRHCLLS